MRYPQSGGAHVFTFHGTDGDRFVRCSCGWESAHSPSKQTAENLAAQHANLNTLPDCPTCAGSGRSELGTDVCGTCFGTGRTE